VEPQGIRASSICKQCGTAQYGEHVLPGSGWIEFVLYVVYIVPGIIYSIWRRSKKRPTCRACGSRDVVSLSTPVGSQLARQHFPDGVPIGAPLPLVPPPVRSGLVVALAASLACAWLFVQCVGR